MIAFKKYILEKLVLVKICAKILELTDIPCISHNKTSGYDWDFAQTQIIEDKYDT